LSYGRDSRRSSVGDRESQSAVSVVGPSRQIIDPPFVAFPRISPTPAGRRPGKKAGQTCGRAPGSFTYGRQSIHGGRPIRSPQEECRAKRRAPAAARTSQRMTKASGMLMQFSDLCDEQWGTIRGTEDWDCRLRLSTETVD